MGIDCERIFGNEGNKNFVIDHVRKIRSIQVNGKFIFQNVPIVFCPEANLGYQHEFLNTSLRAEKDLDPIVTFWDEFEQKVGLWTNDITKFTGSAEIKNYLKTEKISFSQYFFTNSKTSDRRTITPSQMIDEFCSHLESYELKYDNPSPRAKVQKPVARLSGKGGKNFDDLVMALTLTVLAHKRCESNVLLSKQITQHINKIII